MIRARKLGGAACAGLLLSALVFVYSVAASSGDAGASVRATIKASPNPARLGRTTITWQSASASAVVRVSEDGHAPLLFAAAARGTAIAPFVVAGHTYRFSLYASRKEHTALASVVVTGATGIGASPNPAPDGKTTITWQSTNPKAVVRVAVDGHGDTLFSAGGSGSAVASFIASGATYRFSLYSSPHSHTAVASVLVKR